MPTAAPTGHSSKNVSGVYVHTYPPCCTHIQYTDTMHCCIDYLVLEAKEVEEVNCEASLLSSLAPHLYLISTYSKDDAEDGTVCTV